MLVGGDKRPDGLGINRVHDQRTVGMIAGHLKVRR